MLASGTVAAVFTFVAGSFECRLVADGEGVMPAEMMFAGAPEAERGGNAIAIPSGACSSAGPTAAARGSGPPGT